MNRADIEIAVLKERPRIKTSYQVRINSRGKCSLLKLIIGIGIVNPRGVKT